MSVAVMAELVTDVLVAAIWRHGRPTAAGTIPIVTGQYRARRG
jgi:hypothetical protein